MIRIWRDENMIYFKDAIKKPRSFPVGSIIMETPDGYQLGFVNVNQESKYVIGTYPWDSILNESGLSDVDYEATVKRLNNLLDDPNFTFTNGSLNVNAAVTSPLDLDGRLQISSQSTLIEYSHIYDKIPDLKTEVGTGTSVHVSNELGSGVTGVKMQVTAGQYMIREGNMALHYNKGKTQRFECTTQDFQLEEGFIKRIGYFSSSIVAPYDTLYDGMWFESNGEDMEYYLVLSRLGVEVLRQPRSAWIDKLDGTGPSGLTIDFSSFMILDGLFVWLGGKGAAYRIAVNNQLIKVFDYAHAGTVKGLIMNSPNQPIRYEIRGLAGAVGVGTLYDICAQCSTQGALDSTGLPRAVDLDGDNIRANGISVFYAICGVRISQARRNQIANIISFSASAITNDAFRIVLLKNPTVAGVVNWTPYSPYSAIEVFYGDIVGNPSTNAVTFTDDQKIQSFSASSQSGQAILSLEDVLFQLTRGADGTSDIYILAASPATINMRITGGINLIERI